MSLRESNIQQLQQQDYDVLIIGGGINGAVSAASLAAKGLKIALIDRNDFASETSSNSSNLAWGGIKYLENYEFSLVNKLCKSRNHLMENYPSTIKEIRFVTTLRKGFRLPAFGGYLGTLLYWLMGRMKTQVPHYLPITSLNARDAIIDTSNATGGFEYSDCYLYDNDARFVFNFIRSAMDNGCIAANYIESQHSERKDGIWHSTVKNQLDNSEFVIRSKVIINACGPEVDHYNEINQQTTKTCHQYSKGVHLIVDRLTENDHILAFFASDGRLFFVIPMGPKTCIGTTDEWVDTPEVSVTDKDRQFILDNVNEMLTLEKPLSFEDIIAERCGVRPLVSEGGEQTNGDWFKLSRKHIIEADTEQNYLSIFGGKLTDCINIGNEVAENIEQSGINLPYPDKKWYGEPSALIREKFFYQTRMMRLDTMTPASSSEPLSQRLWRRYGDKAFALLDRIRENPDNAKLLIENAEYIRCEVELAAKREMITKLEDFLRRRSKISQVVRHKELITASGLRKACEILFGNQAEDKLQEYLSSESVAHTN